MQASTSKFGSRPSEISKELAMEWVTAKVSVQEKRIDDMDKIIAYAEHLRDVRRDSGSLFGVEISMRQIEQHKAKRATSVNIKRDLDKLFSEIQQSEYRVNYQERAEIDIKRQMGTINPANDKSNNNMVVEVVQRRTIARTTRPISAVEMKH
jgi:hypothetical protein